MKKASTALGGQKHSSSESIEYLFREGSLKSSINQSSGSNYIVLIDAFEHLARRLIFTVYDRMENLKKCGRTSEEAFNECSVDLCKASRAHTRLFIAKAFSNKLAVIVDPNMATVIKDVVTFYLTHELIECAAGLLEDGYLSGQQVAYLRSIFYRMMDNMRPNVVALVDAFDINDRELNSVLGRRDGKVYENLLEWAQLSPLNKTDVINAYKEYLEPYMKQARSKI